MYIIINNTDNTQRKYKGNYPYNYIENLLDNNNDIIVISIYSNTIKVPKGFNILNGIKEYNWTEYKFNKIKL
jgi:hypothetical protein